MGFKDKLKPLTNFQSKLKPIQTEHRFDVPERPEARASRIQAMKAEGAQSAEEAAKANSGWGIFRNTIKNVGTTLANSEVGLGKSIAKIMNVDSDSTKALQQAEADRSANKAKLLKQIRQTEDEGRDATRLKQAYNELLRDDGLKGALSDAFALPTPGQVAGQIGGTALDVLSAGTYGKTAKAMSPGRMFVQTSPVRAATGIIPEFGPIATQKSGGLLTAKGIGNIGKGAAIGYASDVTQGLQGARGEDREGAKAFIPGMGTALGASLPAIAETKQSVMNQFDPETKARNLAIARQKELDKLDSYQVVKKAVEKGRSRGIDIKKVLSETDVLHGAVDNTGTISTRGEGGPIEQYTREFIHGNESIVSDILKKEGKSISPDVVKLKLEEAVMDAGIEGKALVAAKKAIADEMEGYALRAGENGVIPVSVLHDAKIDKYDAINFFTEGNSAKYDKTIAKALKELVEENTDSVDVKAVNEELSKHFAVIDYLKKLDGRKVEGGRLGKYFARTIGAVVGSHFGPLGAIAGAEAGGLVKGGLMSRVFNGKTGIKQPQAQVITDAINVRDAKPLALPQSSSNSLGNLNSNQPNTIAPTTNPIQPTLPMPSNLSPKDGDIE